MDKKIGRNQPCPCGSGLKYKYCCLIKQREYLQQQLEARRIADEIREKKVGEVDFSGSQSSEKTNSLS
jgi:hypothetical protein